MRSLILSIDHWLFKKINIDWSNSFWDGFFSGLTTLNKEPWFMYYVIPAILLTLVYKQKSYAAKAILAIAVTVGLCDLFSYKVLKSQFARQRPHYTDIGAQVKVSYAPTSLSFPSNHALNTFAIANILAYYWPQYTVGYYAFAALMGYSRIYVGVHYPLDVFAGMLFGLLFAIGLRKFLFLRFQWFKK